MQIRNTICTNYIYGGRYKTDDNVILEIDSQGNKKVRFAPVPACSPRYFLQLDFSVRAYHALCRRIFVPAPSFLD